VSLTAEQVKLLPIKAVGYLKLEKDASGRVSSANLVVNDAANPEFVARMKEKFLAKKAKKSEMKKKAYERGVKKRKSELKKAETQTRAVERKAVKKAKLLAELAQIK